MAAPIPVCFIGGAWGEWRVEAIRPVIGESLGSVTHVRSMEGLRDPPDLQGTWTLRGVTGHHRYVVRAEKNALLAVQPPLGRPTATSAALIPIRKTDEWWELPQDDRRALFEERSRHIKDSMAYVPAIARRLYQARELGEAFDFLTWFEYAPEDAERFEELVLMLRSREEWKFVEREVDIRMTRQG